MADSTVVDVSKMKVIDLRKELKSRGLSYAGDKAELVARLQAAMSQDEHGDINLDSDEIDSDGVLEDEDDKSQTDILDDTGVDNINEELALADNSPTKDSLDGKQPKTLKRKLSENDKISKVGDSNKDVGSRKIVLNRATSINTGISKPATETTGEMKSDDTKSTENTKVRITSEIDPKTRLEMRAKRFGLPVKITEDERKEARKQRFGQINSSDKKITGPSCSLSENIDKLKQRAERFGQSVSKIMTDIENKERLERRKAKFGTVK